MIFRLTGRGQLLIDTYIHLNSNFLIILLLIESVTILFKIFRLFQYLSKYFFIPLWWVAVFVEQFG